MRVRVRVRVCVRSNRKCGRRAGCLESAQCDLMDEKHTLLHFSDTTSNAAPALNAPGEQPQGVPEAIARQAETNEQCLSQNRKSRGTWNE